MRRFLLATCLLLTPFAPLRSIDAAQPPHLPPLSRNADQEISLSYHHLADSFYRQVSAQVLLNGARQGLLDALHGASIRQPTLPMFTASENDTTNVRLLVDALKTLYERYGDRVSSTHLMYAEISGMAQALKDRYTIFLNPREYSLLNEGLDGGNFSGVGLEIAIDTKTHELRVERVIPGAPAATAGVQPDDVIVFIDRVATRDQSSEADSRRLRGRSGTIVRLTIKRHGSLLPHPISITRAVIHEPSVVASMLPDHIGYLRLSVFGATTRTEVFRALNHLEEQGAEAFVLDLRDNGGGYLNAAVDVASAFVPSGPIVSVEERGGNATQFNAEDTAISPRPLAVLVNRFTASASEITSGAIQDNKVGTVIGTRTFGKGVVQTIYPLPDDSAIKVTTARYVTPHGRDINSIGITPDISSTLAQNARENDPKTDTQLKTAITLLQAEIAKSKEPKVQTTAKPPAPSAPTLL